MTSPLHLFDAYGVELEYMIVRRDTLDVFPVCDEVLKAVAGEYASEIESGPTAWSNELTLHVVEMKTNGPAPSLDGLGAIFQRDVETLNELLEPLGGMLLPTSMHPWMEPGTETRLWPHDYSPIYEAYNRIFDCRGHGWANVQSTHINLPFCGDGEFARLHAAIRLVLPLLPSLAASSPIVELKPTGIADTRLDYYKNNQRRIPIVTGKVIPEPVFTHADYEDQIFRAIDNAIAPLDPDKLLVHHFLNSRGAIARFDRGAIEIRLLDIQECPLADLAVVALVTETVKALANEEFAPLDAQKQASTDALRLILDETIGDGESATLHDAAYLELLGINNSVPMRAGDVWQHLLDRLRTRLGEYENAAAHLIGHGTLSRRILRALSTEPTQHDIERVYRTLGDCLAEGKMFEAPV